MASSVYPSGSIGSAPIICACRPAPLCLLHKAPSSDQLDGIERLREELRKVKEENGAMRNELAEGRTREVLNFDEPEQDYPGQLMGRYQEIEYLHGAYDKILKSREEHEDKRKAELYDMKTRLQKTDELLVAQNEELRDIKTKLQQTDEVLAARDVELGDIRAKLQQADELLVVRNAELNDIKTNLAIKNTELQQIKNSSRQTEASSSVQNAGPICVKTSSEQVKASVSPIARSLELDPLRTFLPEVYHTSFTKRLKRMVVDLNEEIFQLTLVIVDSMEGKFLRGYRMDQKPRNDLSREEILSKRVIQCILGDNFISSCGKDLPIALQTCMSAVCQMVAGNLSREAGKRLLRILDANAGPDLSAPALRKGPENRREWEGLMVATLIDVLKFCGHQNFSRQCIGRIKYRTRWLVNEALKLDSLIAQGIFWTDVDVFWIPAQSPFLPYNMIDGFGLEYGDQVPPDTPIIATTALGVSIRKRRVDCQDPAEQFGDWVVLLKATVVLPGEDVQEVATQNLFSYALSYIV